MYGLLIYLSTNLTTRHIFTMDVNYCMITQKSQKNSHVYLTSEMMFCPTNLGKHLQCHLRCKELEKLSGFLVKGSIKYIKIK